MLSGANFFWASLRGGRVEVGLLLIPMLSELFCRWVVVVVM